MTNHGHELTLSKTEIVVLIKKWMNTIVPLRVWTEEVITYPQLSSRPSTCVL